MRCEDFCRDGAAYLSRDENFTVGDRLRQDGLLLLEDLRDAEGSGDIE